MAGHRSRSPTRTDERLYIDESEIRRNAPGHPLWICWRQWRVERALAQRGIAFRKTRPEDVDAAYSAMSEQEFDAVNGRQEWANWRTIPRCMTGLVPDRPLEIVDLGCGHGSSTRVLAYYAPLGSHILGFEISRSLLAIARRGEYRHRSGSAVSVDFFRQEACDHFRTPDGRLLGAHTIDLVNASGVIGQHLDPESVRILAIELNRVIRPHGLAMLDVGPAMTSAKLTRIMTAAGFRRLRFRRSWAFDLTGQVVYRALDAA